MPYNGSGTFSPYSIPPGYPAVSGQIIEAAQFNNVISDISAGLTNAVTRDGQGAATADQPMGGNKHTNVGNATARTNYATAAQVQDGSLTWLSAVSGNNSITATAPLSMPAYVAGQRFAFVAAGSNTTGVTLNINGLGAKSVVKRGGDTLSSGDIASGSVVEVYYDGSKFQIANLISSFGTDITVNGVKVGRGLNNIDSNTAVGRNALMSSTTALHNTIVGSQAGDALTTGGYNSAIGSNSLSATDTGTGNVAVGYGTLESTTTALNTVTIGYVSGNTSQNIDACVGVGAHTLRFSNGAVGDVAVGYGALSDGTAGSYNTAVGHYAARYVTTGTHNTCLGHQAGYNLTTGGNNVLLGYAAGYAITTGAYNVVVGHFSGDDGSLDITTSNNNIVISDGVGNRRANCNAQGSWFFGKGLKSTQVTVAAGATATVTVPTGCICMMTASGYYDDSLIFALKSYGGSQGCYLMCKVGSSTAWGIGTTSNPSTGSRGNLWISGGNTLSIQNSGIGATTTFQLTFVSVYNSGE